jgi:hypothetical protein
MSKKNRVKRGGYVHLIGSFTNVVNGNSRENATIVDADKTYITVQFADGTEKTVEIGFLIKISSLKDTEYVGSEKALAGWSYSGDAVMQDIPKKIKEHPNYSLEKYEKLLSKGWWGSVMPTLLSIGEGEKKAQIELLRLVDRHIDRVSYRTLPRLYKYISTDNGRQSAIDMIFSMCNADGVSVQSAMAQLDSDL